MDGGIRNSSPDTGGKVHRGGRGAGGQRGQTLVMMALMLVGLVAFLALVVDLGNVFAQRRRIQNAADAIEFLMAGATAVAVGTANFYEPQTALQVIAGLREFMQRKGLQDVRELTGSVRTEA